MLPLSSPITRCRSCRGVGFVPTCIRAAVQDPKPHVSLAWVLGDCTEALQQAIDACSLDEAGHGEPDRGLMLQQQV